MSKTSDQVASGCLYACCKHKKEMPKCINNKIKKISFFKFFYLSLKFTSFMLHPIGYEGKF